MKTSRALGYGTALFGLVLAAVQVVAAQDRPIQIDATRMPPYPFTVLDQGYVRGDVIVAVEVGADGRLLDALVTATTHPYFGEAALGAIRHWRFQPALHDGRPVTAVRLIRVHFQQQGAILAIQTGEENFREVELDPEFMRNFYHSYTVNQVQEVPRPVSVSTPQYPAALRADGVHGVVRLNYYIDEEGRVRVPQVVSSPSPALTAAVLAAAKTWRFTPAELGGRPVLLQVAQSIRFGDPVQGNS